MSSLSPVGSNTKPYLESRPDPSAFEGVAKIWKQYGVTNNSAALLQAIQNQKVQEVKELLPVMRSLPARVMLAVYESGVFDIYQPVNERVKALGVPYHYTLSTENGEWSVAPMRDSSSLITIVTIPKDRREYLLKQHYNNPHLPKMGEIVRWITSQPQLSCFDADSLIWIYSLPDTKWFGPRSVQDLALLINRYVSTDTSQLTTDQKNLVRSTLKFFLSTFIWNETTNLEPARVCMEALLKTNDVDLIDTALKAGAHLPSVLPEECSMAVVKMLVANEVNGGRKSTLFHIY